jgi:hypothetical protein
LRLSLLRAWTSERHSGRINRTITQHTAGWAARGAREQGPAACQVNLAKLIHAKGERESSVPINNRSAMTGQVLRPINHKRDLALNARVMLIGHSRIEICSIRFNFAKTVAAKAAPLCQKHPGVREKRENGTNKPFFNLIKFCL